MRTSGTTLKPQQRPTKVIRMISLICFRGENRCLDLPCQLPDAFSFGLCRTKHGHASTQITPNLASFLPSATTMEHDPIFPQELFDIVIDDLAHDLETLRSCALVSRSFYTRARVFSHIRVSTGPPDGKGPEHTLAKLHALLQSSPSFAARVESVHLFNGHSPWMAPTSEPQSTSDTTFTQIFFSPNHNLWMGEPPMSEPRNPFEPLTAQSLSLPSGWTIHDPSEQSATSDRQRTSDNATLIPKILTLLLSLQRLRITNATSPFLHSISSALTHRPSLTALDLAGGSTIPPTLFAHCPSLRSLTLTGVSFSDPERLDTFVRPKLDHLALVDLPRSTLPQLARWLLLPKFPLDLSRLRSLVCTGPRDRLLIQRLLAASARSLQHLDVRTYDSPYEEGGDDDETLDLFALTTLHTLSLTIRPTWPRTSQLFDAQRVLSLDHVVFPSESPAEGQALALVLDLCTSTDPRYEIVRQITTLPLALLPCTFSSVTVIFRPQVQIVDYGKRRERVIDVSGEFVDRMPLLAGNLGGRVRVLEGEPK
ncbi:hypothetical protein B0H12DRAFT_477392 [Mycena haematopus]|nr:hypothetical protein B0H12DRAFT_477392 [Mycena haematopus]